MKSSSVRSGPAFISLCLLLAPALAGPAGADVLTSNDAAGFSSLTNGLNWLSGIAPAGGTIYSTTNFALRTPDSATGNVVFAGDSLAIDPIGSLVMKAAAGGTVTVSNLILNGGSIQQWFSPGAATVAGRITVSNNSTFILSSATNTGVRTLVVSAPIGGPAGLAISDGQGVTNFGTLIFSASNRLASFVNVAQCTLSLSNAYAVGGATNVAATNGAAIQANLSTNYAPVPLTIMGAGPVSTPNGGALFFNNGGAATVTWPGAITLSPTSTIASFGTNYTISLTNIISGAGPLTISSRGSNATNNTATWTLAGPNIYSGNTTLQNNDLISLATFKIGLTNSLPVTTVLTLSTVGSGSNSVFDLNGRDQALAGLQDGVNVTRARVINASSAIPSVLTVSNSSPATNTFSGIIGAGGTNLQLVKIGSGTQLLLTNANSYSRGTIIAGGTLQIGNIGSTTYENTGAMGAGTVTITNGGTLYLLTASTANSFNFANNVVIDNGTIYSQDGNQHFTNDTMTILAGGATFRPYYDTKSLYIDSFLQGSGPITINTPNNNSSGVQFSNATNSYSGTITINSTCAKLNQNRTLTNVTFVVSAANGLQFNTGVTAPLIGALSGASAESIAGVTLSTGNNNSNTTYSGALSGAGTLVKIGTNNFTLSGSGTHSAGTLVSNGTLTLAASGILSNGFVTVAPSATMQLNGNIASGPVNVNGLMVVGAGGGASNSVVTVGAGGTLDVTAFGSYLIPAGQTIQGNGLVTGNVKTISAPAAKILPGSLGTPGTLTFANDVLLDPACTNYFDLTNSLAIGGGTNDWLVVNGDLAGAGSVICINPLSPLVSGTYRLINYAGSELSNFSNVVLGATSRDTWTLLDAGTGVVELAVSAGTNLALRWSANNSADWDLGITNWTVVGYNVTDRFYDVDSVLFDDSGAASNIVSLSTLVKPSFVTVNSSSNYTIQGAGLISDGFGQLPSLTKGGSGTLTILTTNTFSGGTTISNGTLQLGNGAGSAAIGSGPVQNNSILAFNNGDSSVFANVIIGNGGVTKSGTGTISLVATNLFAGGITIGSGTLGVGGSGQLGGGSYSMPILDSGILAFSSSTNQTLSGEISGSGTLAVTGTGTLTLTATNSFSGGAYAGGYLCLSTPNSSAISCALTNQGWIYIGSAANQFAGNTAIVFPTNGTPVGPSWGTIELDGYNQTVEGIVGGNASWGYVEAAQNRANGSTATLTIATSPGDGFVFSGAARNQSGVFGLTKTGQGTQTLAGVNITYTGGTLVDGGTLVLRDATAFASAVSNNATLEFNSTAPNDATPDWGYAKTLSGSGTVNKTGTGWFHINVGTVAMSGQINVQGGIFSGNTGGSTWTGNTANLDVSAGAVFSPHGNAVTIGALTGAGIVSNMGNAVCTLTFGAANRGGTFTGNIGNNANALSLTKIGAGTQALTGTNAHTGVTSVNGGTLALAAGAVLSVSPRIIVSTGAAFDVTAIGTFGLGNLQSLEGFGIVTGGIQTATGSRIVPGAIGTAGTLTLGNNLYESAATTNYFDLNPGAPGDLVNVGGNLEPSNAVVVVNLTAPLTNGSYTLFTYGGQKISSFTANAITWLGSATNVAGRRTYTIDETVLNQINLAVGGTNQILRWNPAVSTNWDFAGANWQDITALTNTAFMQQDTVLFDDIGAISNGVVLTTNIAPQSVTVNSASNYTISGNGKITGYTGINKDGTGKLDLGGTGNDFTGPVIITNGILRTITASALGATNGSTTVFANGALDVNGLNLGQEVVNIIGAGFGGLGTIINGGAQQINALQYVKLLGDATVGGSNRWDIRAGTAPYLDQQGFTLTKVGTNYIALVGAVDTNGGDIVVNNGWFSLETTSIVSGPGSVYVNPLATLQFYQSTTNISKPVVLNGGLVYCGSAGTVASSFLINTNSAISTAGGNLLLTNVISGVAGFTKLGANTLTLVGTNSFGGGITITGGVLNINSDATLGSIPVTPLTNLTFAASATLQAGTNGISLAANRIVAIPTNSIATVDPQTNLMSIGGALIGAGGLTKPNAGTVTLAGGGSLGNTITATAGTLVFNGGTLISTIFTNSRSINLQNGATFIVTNNAILNLAGTISLGTTAAGNSGNIIQYSGSLIVNGSEPGGYYRALQIGEYPAETSTYTMYGGSLYVTNGLLFLPWNATQGVWSIYGGTSVVKQIANNSGGFGYLNFVNGSVIVGSGGISNIVGTSVFNLGGGTLGAYANWASALNMNLTGTNGPTTFDTAANTITLSGVLSGTGGLIKAGSGSLTLSSAAAYTYAGDTVVNNGTLTLSGTAVGGGTNKLAGAWIYVNPGSALNLAAGAQLNYGPGTPSVSLNGGTLAMTDGQYNYVKNLVLTNGSTWALGTGLLTTNGLTGANFGLSNVISLASSSSNIITSRGGAIAANTGIKFVADRGTSSADLIVSAVMSDYNGTGSITKTGSGILVLTATNNYTGPTTISNGTLLVQGYITGPASVSSGGTLGGTGLVKGPVTSAGTVAPGASAGTLTLANSYTQTVNGTLSIEIGGLVAPTDYDQLIVSNNAALAGKLQVSLINGFMPSVGDTFIVLKAAALGGTTFTSTDLPSLGTNIWNVGYELDKWVVLSVTNPPVPTGYDAWATGITNGQTAYNQFATGDGYPNLLKYATGSSPTNSDGRAQMNSTQTNGLFALKFSHNTNTTDLILYVEGTYTTTNDATWVGIATNDHGSWGSATNVSEDTSTDPATDVVWDTDATATNRFLRLRVTRP